MNREELINKLELVKPALSDFDLVPVLSKFWFRDNKLMAYNDSIAISTDLKSDFEGAVPNTLVQLLSASRAKDVEFLPNENELTVKAASSKLKLPFMDVKSTDIFDMPKISKNTLPVDMKEFLAAVQSCMRSLKEDTSIPDSLGITLSFIAGSIHLYTTNDSTISHAVVPQKNTRIEGETKRLVISGEFCRQMLNIAKTSDKMSLEITDDYSLFVAGNTFLFGRLIEVPKPLDFESVIKNSCPKNLAKVAVQVPTKLELILERAIIITDSKQDRPKTTITVKDGIANFYSTSADKGEVKDTMQLEGHPDVEMVIDPRLFKVGFGAFSKMYLTENCLIMTEGSDLYLVSASR